MGACNCESVSSPTARCSVQVSYMPQRLQMAFQEVLASQDLAMLLFAVVDQGNVLNAGSQRGGAQGYKFDLLLRLPAHLRQVRRQEDKRPEGRAWAARGAARHQPRGKPGPAAPPQGLLHPGAKLVHFTVTEF